MTNFCPPPVSLYGMPPPRPCPLPPPPPRHPDLWRDQDAYSRREVDEIVAAALAAAKAYTDARIAEIVN